MQPTDHQHTTRRTFIVSAATSMAALQSARAAGQPVIDRQLQFTSLAAAEAELLRLASAKGLQASPGWSWGKTLVHCAQSIDFSLSGFPEPKPRLFQLTVGAAAFEVFAWRGRMSHDLSAPIPGAPAISEQEDAAKALQQLRASINRFQQWKGPLQPHFAYGALNKAEYELAHAMHLANHLSAFQAQG